VLGIARELFANSPLANYVLDEDFPGPAVSTHDDVVRYAIETGSGIFHAVGASAMGPDADDVVDPQLPVRGVSGLRVVDASVPACPGRRQHGRPNDGGRLDRCRPHP